MSYVLLNGKDLAGRIKQEIKEEVAELTQKNIIPGLAVVIVGNDPASRSYINNKRKDCDQVGIRSFEYALPEETNEEQLLGLIDTLNNDSNVDGILVQAPLPAHLDESRVFRSIRIDKDVDAFHPFNVGELMLGKPTFLPCTPAGIMALLSDAGIDVAGKNSVVIGRSNIVGKPMAMLLLHAHATVTICHSKTRNLREVCKTADILISAIGKRHFVTREFIKPGAVVIDVGINRTEDGKMTGDVDFESVAEITSHITPVPGGVGPMTRAMLLKNTLKAVIMHKKALFS